MEMEMERVSAAEVPIHLKMAELRVACQRQIQIRQQRSNLAASSFRESLRSIKAEAEENLGNRENLGKLQDYLRKLETDLADAVAAKTCKEAKCAAIADTIATRIARTEHLEKKIQDQKTRKDEYAAYISQQMQILEALEKKSKEDMAETDNVEEAIRWYNRVLGFRTEGGEGVKFMFKNINMKNPDEVYSLTVRLDGDKYHLMNCDPYVEDIHDMMKDLNKSNDLFKFVRIMRGKFQAAALNGALLGSSSLLQDSTSITISSPPPISVHSRNVSPMKENVPDFQSKRPRLKAHQSSITRHGATPSPKSILNLRRSPRFLEEKNLKDSTLT